MSHARTLLPLLAAALLAGCHVSDDKHTFTSTVWQPMNIEVLDQITRKRLWYYEIPTYHKLTLEFTRPPEVKFIQVKPHPATEMRWTLKHVEKNGVVDKGEQTLSGMPIIMRMSIREAPELPPDLQEAQRALLANDSGEIEIKRADAPAEAPASVEAAPSVEPVEVVEAPPVIVEVADDGSMKVGKHAVDADRLGTLMKALVSEAPDRQVIVRPSLGTPAAQVTAVQEICRNAGVNNVTVETPKAEPAETTEPAEAPATE